MRWALLLEIPDASVEGIIKVGMRTLSITRRSINAVKAAFGRSDAPAELLPGLRMITHAPEPVSEPRSATELPPSPANNQGMANLASKQEKIMASATKEKLGPASPSDKADEEFMELKLICEAIGLDPKELMGDPAPPDVAHPRSPAFHVSRERTIDAPATPKPAYNASDMAALLASLKLRLLKLRLDPDDIAETQAEIDTAVAQLFSPRPKLYIIAASVKTILSIVGTAGPAALTQDVETSLDKLRTFLQQLNV